MTIKINFNFGEWLNYNRKLLKDLKVEIFGNEQEYEKAMEEFRRNRGVQR